ncbi:MAG: sigma factor [Planctomycetota bacterium]
MGDSHEDDEAYAALVQQHGAFVERVASRLISDPASAEDLVHETWLTALSYPAGRIQHVRA